MRSFLPALAVFLLSAVVISGAPRSLTSAVIAPSLAWQGPQYLQAGSDGEVRLLRGDNFDIYSLGSNRAEASLRRLQRPSLSEDGTTAAAMSPDGSRWVVNSANRILAFRGGQVEILPDVGWFVTSVGFLGDVMIAGVLPMSVGGGLQHATRPSAPPMIVSYEGGRWSTKVRGTFPRRSHDHDPIGSVFAEHSIRLAAAGPHAFWATYPYLGRAIRYTAAGRPDLEVVLGTGTARYREDEERLHADFRAGLSKQGYDLQDARTGVFSARLQISGMTVAADGTAYFAIAPAMAGRDTLIVRFDPARGTVQSAPLALAAEGELSLAAGRDGLYLGAAQGDKGRWRIGWESLNQAVWRDLPGVTVERR